MPDSVAPMCMCGHRWWRHQDSNLSPECLDCDCAQFEELTPAGWLARWTVGGVAHPVGAALSDESDLTPTVLPDTAMESLCDAFVEANRAEFMDTDFDVPILRAVEALARQAWHEGYGAGSSAATDGWLDPLAPRITNPYVRLLPPGTTGGDNRG